MKLFPSRQTRLKVKTDPCLPSPNRSLRQFRRPKNNPDLDREGLHPILHDPYHWLLSISWLQFLGVVALTYFVVNFGFALIYLTGKNGIANAHPRSLTDHFFFSIQTLSTVGYGSMYPKTFYTQVLVTVEILVGLVLMAILTGLMFARFARPTAKVLFSRVAVICPYNGVPTFMFRAANKRNSHVLEAQVQVSFLRNEISPEGHQLRRFYDLELTRSRTPVFGLSWLVMHPINEHSPLYGKNLESLAEAEGEVWITLTGIEEIFSQTIHARHFYQATDILWNMHFVDIFSRRPNGERVMDLKQFHDVIPIELDQDL